MDDHLKELIQKLGQAINESLSESESIAEIIGEIRAQDYDVFLLLEATIGFNKRETGESNDFEATTIERVSFSEQDQAFLKALKIDLDE